MGYTGPMDLTDSLPDADWQACFEAVDRAFAGLPRPAKFTDHPYCDECAEADAFFQSHTRESLAVIDAPVETLPLSFLTPEGFLYFMPALLRRVIGTGLHDGLGDLLFHVENRLHLFNTVQKAALRDVLYLAYVGFQVEVHRTAFDYPALWRLLDRLDEEVS